MGAKVEINTARILESIPITMVWAGLVSAIWWFVGYQGMAQKVENLELEVAALETKDAAHEAAERGVEIQLARMETTLTNIEKNQEYFRARLEDME